MTCLDDETVLRLIDGQLAAAALAAIDGHLDDCASCRDVVVQVARTQPTIARGRTIGRYVIGELLGAGAMGRVYSAWEPELDRRVAIKVLHDGPRRALVREAQAMARLSHPNVVAVHEVGTTDDAVYVAMELVAGESLRAWATRPRTPREKLAVLVDVARGLAAVHAAGVIHRDIKPDNVIVGDDGRARLGDFGLARTGGEATAAAPVALAEASTTAGTPVYMAPEVLRGGAATAASDQFSFGVTAYELVGGARPFAGRTWAELVRAIERGELATSDPIIRRCLAVDPAGRWPSMAVVAEQLAARASRRRPLWIAGVAAGALVASVVTWGVARTPAAAPPSCEIGAAELAATWPPSTRGQLAPLATAALDAWGTRWIAERDATCRAGADVPPQRLAARERCLGERRAELGALVDRIGAAGALSDHVTDALAALPSPTECRAADVDSAAPLPLDPARAEAARAVVAELLALRVAVALGGSDAVTAQATALVARARLTGHAPTLAAAELVRADALAAGAHFDDAALAARDAIGDAERGRADATGARAWLTRVAIAGDRRALADADDFAALAAAAIDRAGAPDHLVALLARMRGLVAYNRGDLVAARTLLAFSRARFVADAGEHSLDVATVDSAAGSVARATGDLDTAERDHRAALAVDRELRGPQHPDVARDLHNLAGVLRLRGDLDYALGFYREALAIAIATRGPRSVAAGLTHNSIALVEMARQDWPAARADLELARDALTTAQHGDRAFAEHNLGLVAVATGDPAGALAHYAIAAEVYRATIGDHAPAALRLVDDRAAAQRALAAKHPQTRRAAPPVEPTLPLPAPPPPVVAAPPPQPPPPRHDVGVYGASQPWQ